MNNESSDIRSTQNHEIEPWFKQGWPWALIAIPFLTVIAGVITFMIAKDTSDSLVQDDYYKKGLAINSNLERLNFTQSMQLIADIEVDTANNLIIVKLEANENSQKQLSNQLSINFSHPTLKSKDKSFQLSQLSKNEFVADFTQLDSAYWHIQIEDESKTWLLKGRWLYPDQNSIIINSNLTKT